MLCDRRRSGHEGCRLAPRQIERPYAQLVPHERRSSSWRRTRRADHDERERHPVVTKIAYTNPRAARPDVGSLGPNLPPNGRKVPQDSAGRHHPVWSSPSAPNGSFFIVLLDSGDERTSRRTSCGSLSSLRSPPLL